MSLVDLTGNIFTSLLNSLKFKLGSFLLPTKLIQIQTGNIFTSLLNFKFKFKFQLGTFYLITKLIQIQTGYILPYYKIIQID